jgi:hypothetical protein
MMLPSDRYLAEILGLTEEQYRHFQIEVRKRAAEGPQPAVVAGTATVIAIANLVIGLGALAVSALLKPTTPQPGQAPGQPRQTQDITDPIIRNSRFAPRYGFDSQQDIATLGSIIPIVYAKREAISGNNYGGIRINMPMLWNQILSLGGGQMLRGVFLLGEGTVSSIDTTGFAIGSNTLQGYVFDSTSATESGSRVTVYFSGNGGRIRGTDRVLGRTEANDDGSSGALDVFRVYWDGQQRTDFCSSNRPSTQTTFGVYAPIGNNLLHKVNPVIRPGVRSQYQANTTDGRLQVDCPNDDQQINRRDKFRANFSTYSGVIGNGTEQSVAVGTTVTYKLFYKSDWLVTFGSGDDKVEARDVASSVASLQKGWDDRIVVGEVYKIGTALAVCTSRTAGQFVSEADLDGSSVGAVTVTATFSVVEAGLIKGHQEEYITVDGRIKTLGAITGGDNYTAGSYANVPLTGGSGFGATAKVVVKMLLGSITGGSGYVTGDYPGVSLTGGSGSGATADIEVDGTGAVSQVTIVNSGTGYAVTDVLSADAADLGGSGSGFSVPVTATNGIDSVTIVEPGYGYAAADSLSAAAADIGGTGSGFAVVVSAVSAGGDAGTREKATTGGHLLRYARGQVATTRGCQAVELGLKSTLGIRINNLCNFRDAKSYEFADTNYCQEFANANINQIKSSLYQSGVITSPVQRYSFFKIKYRDITSSSWTTLTHAYGVRSETQQALFTYIRLEFSSVNQREFMFEPLSGFEIRNGHYGAGATLYVLDPKKDRITVSENGTTAVFNGESVALNDPTDSSKTIFGINYGRAVPELDDDYTYENRTLRGLPLVDTNTYIDDYGKLAETFVYAEISSSADSGPEHEIVYVNEIVPNGEVAAFGSLVPGDYYHILTEGNTNWSLIGFPFDASEGQVFLALNDGASQIGTTGVAIGPAPNYSDLALIGVNIRSSAEWQQFAQFSSYVTGGKECTLMLGGSGATHLLPDVLYDLMTDIRYGAGSFIKPYMINTTEFAAAAQWCFDRKYFYDAAVAEPINIRQWAADLAATHLLQFGEIDGKYFLRPAISFTAVSIAGLFTAGNIAEGSFNLQYFDPEDRDPIQVSVRYREERPSNDLASPGLFPVVREVLVRESDAAGGSDTDPIEQLDMSAYCTSRTHAIDAAKFLIRMRRIPTHTITFKTMHDGLTAGLAPGDYIKVAMDETEYDEFNNGVVTPEGALVSTKALSDGTYNVVAWDGTEGTPPADATLTVSNSGKTGSPTGIVFTVKLPATQVRVYQVERITPDDEGTFTIEAMHMPVNSSGVLEVAAGFDTAGNWEIQG